MPTIRELKDADATMALGVEFSDHLQPGDRIEFEGNLGAGKTTFVRGLVDGLGGDTARVSSPTYTLMHIYECRMPVVHVDAYRVRSAWDLEELELDQWAENGVLCLEWPRFQEVLDHTRVWKIALEPTDSGGRRATIHEPSGSGAV